MPQKTKSTSKEKCKRRFLANYHTYSVYDGAYELSNFSEHFSLIKSFQINLNLINAKDFRCLVNDLQTDIFV